MEEKPDSQDFYAGNRNDILENEEKIGAFVDRKGNILGRHKGIWNFTIGQRRGLGISADQPIYVLELKKETNEVVVGYEDEGEKTYLEANNLTWLSIEKPEEKFSCFAKIRSSQTPFEVDVSIIDDDNMKVFFKTNQKAVAPGQSIVLYDDDIILGGGIIKKF